jgi:uncharacterized protein YfeS
MAEMKVMLFKTTRIKVDENGLVCLNDIHIAAGFSKSHTTGYVLPMLKENSLQPSRELRENPVIGLKVK